ncbi:unnamed protein product [Spirodela intermedia]|uniref:SAWADEE domain-containing protein n=1 Tax=Spirodela intermedia TaxID=51605 RepID=A0A7I8JPI6_SPIIN|nr:unnamed protein product [Spirodela intermedia]CAA6672084.1 unnamed protein product [Spirodela intermedia]
MEACLQVSNNVIPDRDSSAPRREVQRSGKVVVQPKQVCSTGKVVKAPGKLNVTPAARDEPIQFRNVASPAPSAQAKNSLDGNQMEFEAKSARDGAWYDVAQFISHRMFETGDPEVLVRFSGFGIEEDEWVNVRKCVRQRSLPCEASECVVVLPGDLILCFQEGKEQALYFDAHVLDAQRRRHDARGCRCRFLVRYDHDQSEEIVPLRKVCRRPETEYRLRILQATKAHQASSPEAAAAAASQAQPQKLQRPTEADSAEATAPRDAAAAEEAGGPPAAAGDSNAEPVPDVEPRWQRRDPSSCENSG